MLNILIFTFLAGGCYQKPSFQRGHAYFMSGQYFNAFKQFQELGLQGDARAAYTVGYCYYYGIGVAPDEDEARTWIRIAAKRHYPPAQVALDMVLKNGLETPPPSVLAPENARVSPIKYTPAKHELQPVVIHPQPEPDIIWINSQPPKYFTLQCSNVKTREMKEELKNLNNQSWRRAHYRSPENNDGKKATIYGSFSTLEEAAEAKAKLPIYLRNHMHIKSFKEIQALVASDMNKADV